MPSRRSSTRARRSSWIRGRIARCSRRAEPPSARQSGRGGGRAERGDLAQSPRVVLLLRDGRHLPAPRAERKRAAKPSRCSRTLERESNELEKKRRKAVEAHSCPSRRKAGVSRAGARSHRAAGSCDCSWVAGVAAACSRRRGIHRLAGPASAAAGHLHGRDRSGRSVARPLNVSGSPDRQAVPARGDGRRRRALRLRPRRLARHLPGQRQQLRARGSRPQADELSVSQQPRRHVHRRHAKGGPDPFGLGTGLLRRRLRQRRLRRSVRQLLGPERSLSEQRQWHVHRRDRTRGRRRSRRINGVRAVVSWTSIATATSICSSPAT